MTMEPVRSIIQDIFQSQFVLENDDIFLLKFLARFFSTKGFPNRIFLIIIGSRLGKNFVIKLFFYLT